MLRGSHRVRPAEVGCDPRRLFRVHELVKSLLIQRVVELEVLAPNFEAWLPTAGLKVDAGNVTLNTSWLATLSLVSQLAAILRIVDAATRAPSAHNRQPWRFRIVREAAEKSGLAEAMGARLWCEPAAGSGARFVLALPAAVAV